mmetsp:Transcript_16086/g.33396  ORF Transcript_16086/g.33396 Transcript_16086/m.33396 type:complete len:385 (+) Transcript_16086:82-1236(+)
MLRRGGGHHNTKTKTKTSTNSGSSRTVPVVDGVHNKHYRAERTSAAAIAAFHGTTTPVDTTTTKPLRGLLKIIQGQVGSNGCTSSTEQRTSISIDPKLVSVYRYHGETLRKSQVELQKKRKRRRKPNSTNTHQHTNNEKHNDEDSWFQNNPQNHLLQHSSASMPFAQVVGRHRFVAFFVIQGWRRARAATITPISTASTVTDGNQRDRFYYSAHTLNLRQLLATDYHDVMSTFVLDLTDGCCNNNNNNNNCSGGDGFSFCDEETGGASDGYNDNDGTSNFCRGTGFAILKPTTTNNSNNTGILLTLLGGISKVPSVVVVDTVTGRTLSKDVVLAIQKNDAHAVVNRWQQNHHRSSSSSSGLTPCQSICTALLCESEEYSCCVVQ